MSQLIFGTVDPLLDARLQGAMFETAPASAKSSYYFNFPFDCNFNGVDFYAWSPNSGDNLDLYTEYTTDGGTTWLRYKKFGKKWYVMPEKERVLLFPTTPSVGVRLRVDYDNVGPDAVKFVLNLWTFVDQTLVDPAQGQQGEDW